MPQADDFYNLFDNVAIPPALRPAQLNSRPYTRPYLLMDLPTVGARLQEFARELPGVDVHYAVKCNPHPKLSAYIHQQGGKFEVASIAELRQLHKLGVNPRDVLFSNPVKLPAHIKAAHKLGLYRFSFDSEQELHKIQQNAPGASVYVRMATSTAESVVHSEGKFGISPDDAYNLLLKARAIGLTPYGIAFHVGSQVETPDLWRYAIRDAASIMRRLPKDIKLQMLDLGGGFPATHKAGLPTVADIGKTIREALKKELPYMPKKLAIEPGRGLVSEAGVMVASVIGVITRGTKTWVHLDLGGFTIFEALETGNQFDYPVADSRQNKTRMTANITAATCDSMDTILYGNHGLSADLQLGDRVYIYTAGAYTSSYASTFNGFPLPAVTYTGE